MRYVGQGYEVRVPFAMEPLTAAHVREMQRGFEAEYRAFYGQLADGVPIEAVNWRVLIRGPRPKIESAAFEESATLNDTPVACRSVRFAIDQAPLETPVYRREQLGRDWSAGRPLDHRGSGIDDGGCTWLVRPGCGGRLPATDAGKRRRILMMKVRRQVSNPPLNFSPRH